MISARTVLLALGLVAAVPAGAQMMTGGGDAPVEIDAEDGIEWLQAERAYVARGNALARQGDLEVRAQVLTAFYRDAETDGEGGVYRLEAEPDVEISTGSETVRGRHAVYLMDEALLEVTGRPRLETAERIVTARDRMLYWRDARTATAEGDVVMVDADKEMRADRMSAWFAAEGAEQGGLETVAAEGNVVIATATDVTTGDYGVYDLASDTACLTGGVTITQGETHLQGSYAQVDLTSGVSRLLVSPPAEGLCRSQWRSDSGRVHGIITLDDRPSAAPPAEDVEPNP